MDKVIANLDTTAANLSSSRARITEADFATETVNVAKGYIFKQASTAMLARANIAPQAALQLLR